MIKNIVNVFRFIKKFLVATIVFFVPIKICWPLLSLFGFEVDRDARVGFSLVWVNSLTLEEKSRIGHFNIIRCREFRLSKSAYIGMLNIVLGPFDLTLGARSSIGTSNTVSRARHLVGSNAVLTLGVLSKITSNHKIDCFDSISFGDFTTLAGSGSQLWTHSFKHDREGPGRNESSAEIIIGNNVYIGSGSILTAGITIGSSIGIGPGSVVTKSLFKSGQYLQAPPMLISVD